MRAYHGDPAIKDRYLVRVRAHRAADAIVRGIGWDGKRGCAIGCTLERYDHARYPIELGVPEVIARLEDQLHEMQPHEASLAWPERVLDAIPVGADLAGVWGAWVRWVLLDPTWGVIRFAGDRSEVRAAIERVAALYGADVPLLAAAGAAAAGAAGAAGAAAAAGAAGAAAAAAAAAGAAAGAAGAAAAAGGAAGAWAWAAAASAEAARTAWVTAACDELLRLLAATGERP